ncbi:probable RNA-directed DNA polymerase from transposon X-element [Trichonephila clavipes]|nr:probable RNA-directed DNA polymerase from transposon X-element [Trichonephila clavipes]
MPVNFDYFCDLIDNRPVLPTSREDDRLGVIDNVLAFVRNGRYSERTFLPSKGTVILRSVTDNFIAFMLNSCCLPIGRELVTLRSLNTAAPSAPLHPIIDYNPDVIGIQETHLRPADRVSIPNYTCHRSDRTTHRGGGTAIFVKNSIRHHAIVNTSNTFENTSVILHVGNNTKITVACIYRPPHGSINTIELDAILNHSNKAFLFGDFNAKHSSWNPGRSNTNGNILCNWAVGSALDIIAPDTPTHFNAWHTNNILDIGFAANLAHTDVFTINALSSDHNPVIFDFITNNILPPILTTLKSTNWIKFQEILYHNVPENPQIDNLDTAVQNFTDVITNAISASTSTRVINTPHLRLPENIRELIRAKNRFRKLWNNTRYQPYKREVNALIRQIRKEIEAHKKQDLERSSFNFKPSG